MLRRETLREIGLLLALKLAALIVIYLLFFGPEQRVRLTPFDVEDRFLPETAPTSEVQP